VFEKPLRDREIRLSQSVIIGGTMAYWMYKCNSSRPPSWVYRGDWLDFFADPYGGEWGSSKFVPDLARPRPGDTIIAYQTNRNELVGLATVVRHRQQDLILKPVETIGAKIRPLKASSAIARIPALQGGRVATLYSISTGDARRLLRAARRQARQKTPQPEAVEQAARGAGFGTAEENKKVEMAAIAFIRRYYRRLGWSVESCEQEKIGYDLECTKGRTHELHVEVKGIRGSQVGFVITANELKTWAKDKDYVLAAVNRALASRPRPSFFSGAQLKMFAIQPICFMARLNP
jgi:hypothetical protein